MTHRGTFVLGPIESLLVRHDAEHRHYRAFGVLPESTISGTSGNDSLTGGSGADSLSGVAGNDTLVGNDGADTLNGGSGDDSMVGGAGNDKYVVDSLSDLVVESGNGGTDTVNVQTFFYVLPSNVENMTSNAVYGGYLIGNTMANTITGTGLDDLLVGMTGNDTLKGGAGDDTYYVQDKGDVVTEASNAGIDTVVTQMASYTLPGNVEDLIGYGTAGQNLIGNSLDNFVNGDRGADTLQGGSGNDVLDGDGGKDVLTGGSGYDFFLFDTAASSANVVTITDFSNTEDGIGFDSSVFTALSVTDSGQIAASAFKLIGQTIDSNDRILYNQSTGQLYYDPDGSGSSAAVQIATVSGHPALSYENIWVF